MAKETFVWPEFLTVDVHGNWRCHKNNRSVTAVFASSFSAAMDKIYTITADGDNLIATNITEEYNA